MESKLSRKKEIYGKKSEGSKIRGHSINAYVDKMRGEGGGGGKKSLFLSTVRL